MPVLRMFRARAWRSTSTRSSSTFAPMVTGRSGRIYTRESLFRAHPTDPTRSIHLGLCEDEPSILKTVTPSIFGRAKKLQNTFGACPQIRTHVDENEKELLLVYEYYADDGLAFVNTHNHDLPVWARKQILREVGIALKEIHQKKFIHLDVKPNNVMLDWSLDDQGQFVLGRVALGDLDCTIELEDDFLFNQTVGAALWRSPEGQTGRGVYRPSEVFSFGLLTIFFMCGFHMPYPRTKIEKDTNIKAGVEYELLYKLLTMFRPVSSSLCKHVLDGTWSPIIEDMSKAVMKEDPSTRFEAWPKDKYPNLDDDTKHFILRMTNLDPRGRPTIEEVMADPWWTQDADSTT